MKTKKELLDEATDCEVRAERMGSNDFDDRMERERLFNKASTLRKEAEDMDKSPDDLLKEKLIQAVREDKVVGNGTCSVIDEAYTDEELWEEIKNAKTTRGARSIARRIHNTNRAGEAEACGA